MKNELKEVLIDKQKTILIEDLDAVGEDLEAVFIGKMETFFIDELGAVLGRARGCLQ